jgi:hypothetical protein
VVFGVYFSAQSRLTGIDRTPAEMRDLNNFKQRLKNHGERMKAMNINFYRSKLVKWNKE